MSELDLNEIHEGDKVMLEFEWDMDGARQTEGVVSSISRVGEERTEKNTDAEYSAWVDFTPDDSVRLDMSVNVYTLGDDDLFFGETAEEELAEDEPAEEEPAEEEPAEEEPVEEENVEQEP